MGEIKNNITNNSVNSNNISQLDNDNISPSNINGFIDNDIYSQIYVVLNMTSNLCNTSYCYFKFELYNSNNTLFDIIYIKYKKIDGLMNKKLYIFNSITDKEKDLLKNGYIKITAYQLIDCLDNNPYILGSFKFNEMHNMLNGLSLYKVLNITSIYSFIFDKIIIYPISISNQMLENDFENIKINDTGTILNSNKDIKKTYAYSLTYSNIRNNILFPNSIIINIDEDDIWYNYNCFYANLMFYLKNGIKYIIPQIQFIKKDNSLYMNEQIEIDKTKFDLNNISKFTLTSFSGEYSGIKTNLDNINLSKQGNIYKEN